MIKTKTKTTLFRLNQDEIKAFLNFHFRNALFESIQLLRGDLHALLDSCFDTEG